MAPKFILYTVSGTEAIHCKWCGHVDIFILVSLVGMLLVFLLTWGRFDFGGAPKSHRRKIKQLTGDVINTCVHKSFADIVDIFLGKRKQSRF